MVYAGYPMFWHSMRATPTPIECGLVGHVSRAPQMSHQWLGLNISELPCLLKEVESIYVQSLCFENLLCCDNLSSVSRPNGN